MATRYGSLTLQIKALSNLADVGSAYTDTLISANGTQELSKVGRGSFTVSGRAYALLTAVTSNIGQVAYVYITDAVASGAAMDVCAFIIQDIDKTTTDNGVMVTVSGPDLLHQLTYTTLNSDVIDDGSGGVDTTDIDNIMAYAASGWSNTGGNTTSGTYHVSSGNNVLEILIAAAKQSGEMFRLSAISPPAKTVAWLNSADASGVTLRMPSSPIDYDASTTVGIILSMKENNSLGQVVTRVKPHGAGLSDGRLNLRNISSANTGGDPAGYTTWFSTTVPSANSIPNTIVNDTLETSLGYMIKEDVDFSHIRAADPTNATDLATAAVALWNEGLNFLQERDSSNKVYDIDCIVPYDLKPGQTVTVVYTEYEGGITGGNTVWSVNDSFTIHRVSSSVDNSGELAGVRTTSLTVGETQVPRATGSSQVAAALRTTRETTRKADPTTGSSSIPQSRSIATDFPLTGGGDLSGDRTHKLGTLTTFGAANQILGANAAANDIEYKTVTAGTGISVTHGAGTVTITNTDTGSGLSALPFVTIGNSGSLSGERALTAGDGLDLTDGGANSTATLAVDVTDILGNGLTETSNNLTLGTPSTITVATSNGVTSTSHTHAITSSSNPGAAASIVATDSNGYVTLQRVQFPNERYIHFANAAGTDTDAGRIHYSGDDDLSLSNATPGASIIFTVVDSDSVATPYVELFEYGTTDDIQLRFSSQGYITTLSEGITIEPAAGSGVNIDLSTTGDFIVNTDDLVVDTSSGRVGIGTATPAYKLEIEDSVAGVSYVSHQNSATAATSNYAGLVWQLNTSAQIRPAAAFISRFIDTTDATRTGQFSVTTPSSGSSMTSRITVGPGVQIGSPTGGDKGAGTINAAADIYKNNVSYTSPDYALEYWVTGKIEKYKDNEGADGYRRLSIEESEEFVKKNNHLPRISRDPAGIFEMANMSLEKTEELHTYIYELNNRLKKAEAIIQGLLS
jgi:hypothetical protein